MVVYPHRPCPATTQTTGCIFFAALPPVPEQFWNLSWACEDYLLVNMGIHRLQGSDYTLDVRLSMSPAVCLPPLLGPWETSHGGKASAKATLCLAPGLTAINVLVHLPSTPATWKAGIQSVAGSSLLPFTIPVHHVPLRKLEVDQLLSPQKQSGLPVCPPL